MGRPSKHFDPWPPPRGFHVFTVASSVETPDSTYGPWLLDAYGMAWIAEGGGITHLDEHEIRTTPGTVMMMRPGMTLRHDWGKRRTTHCFVVFGFERVPKPWPRPPTWPCERHFGEDAFLLSLWRYLLQFELPAARSVVVPTVLLMLRVFLTEVPERPAAPYSPLPEAVDHALRTIQDRIYADSRSPVRLAELARAAHVSAQHLCRLFKQSLGVSPIDCVQALRVELASTLLERTDLPLAEIADRYGFSSAYHFSRVFKQSYGIAPGGYRTAFRAGQVSRPPGLLYRHHRLRRYFYERDPGKILP